MASALPTPRTAPAPQDDHVIVPVARSEGSDAPGDAPGTGAQLITERVDLPISDLSLSSGLAPTAPGTGAVGTDPATVEPMSFHDARLISAPVPDLPRSQAVAAPTSVVAAAIADAVGTAQAHQLITAMANFGAELLTPLTTSLAQHEVDAARMTLAASLHF